MTPDQPPSIAPNEDEKTFSSDDGWSFVAPKDFVRSTAPGTTGFALQRPPPAKPIANLVLTTEAFDENVSAFVDKERAKVHVVKEEPRSFGVLVEETWPIGEGAHARALVLLAVDKGVGVRLACLGVDTTFESQRPMCMRAIDSLRRLR